MRGFRWRLAGSAALSVIAAHHGGPGRRGALRRERQDRVRERANGWGCHRAGPLPAGSLLQRRKHGQRAGHPAGGQYRHPTWSPDRTKIAYANGTADNNPVTQNFDIFVQDVAAGTGPVPITDTSDSLSADRPAWSPDGTTIA